MPNYGKFLKELISNKHKIEQIYAAFLSDESSAILQNKVPPKLGDPRSFLIPCNFNKTFSCNALADLGASINLMPYSLYAKLSLETLKPTKMSVRLADRSFQYPVGIAENMLVEVGKFTFPVDLLLMYIDVIDEILEEDFDALLDEGSKILYSIEGTILEEEIFSEFDKFIEMTADEIYDSETNTEEPPFEKITIKTNYKIKTSFEEPPTDLELKPLPDNLEYIYFWKNPLFSYRRGEDGFVGRVGAVSDVYYYRSGASATLSARWDRREEYIVKCECDNGRLMLEYVMFCKEVLMMG
ncbi:reverse transcriptase domain-containing protein [Tanacetum coccineum]